MKLSKDELLQLLMQKAVGIITEEDDALVNEILASDEEAAMLWEKVQKIDERNTNSGLFTPSSRSQGWEEVITTVKGRRRKRLFVIVGAILVLLIFIMLIYFLVIR